jgi:hypothetical protein
LKLRVDTSQPYWLESEKLTVQVKPNAEFKTSGQNARYLRAISCRQKKSNAEFKTNEQNARYLRAISLRR